MFLRPPTNLNLILRLPWSSFSLFMWEVWFYPDPNLLSKTFKKTLRLGVHNNNYYNRKTLYYQWRSEIHKRQRLWLLGRNMVGKHFWWAECQYLTYWLVRRWFSRCISQSYPAVTCTQLYIWFASLIPSCYLS